MPRLSLRLPRRFRGLASSLCVALAAIMATPSSGYAEGARALTDFELLDVDGRSHRLSHYRGKWVVLEWVNFDCAPVKAQYQAPASKMQNLQRSYGAKGVLWFTINSSAAGQRGHLSAQQSKTAMARLGAAPSAFLLDPKGTAGKAFGIQVTPEIRVLSPRGEVVYAGGVESAGTQTPLRYLDAVLRAATSGHAIPYARKPASGCRVAYAPTTSAASGPRAPAFTLTDTTGKVRRLSDFQGKWVILEWVNYDCPFVQKHYDASHRNMQALQARAARHGIVWLSICSSAPGKQGHFSAAHANARKRQLGATPVAYLLDPSGRVGRAYGARTTPGMRVISPQGTIEYSGGIDSIRSARASDVARAKNFIALAIADIVARRPIAIKSSRSYGCSVKY